MAKAGLEQMKVDKQRKTRSYRDTDFFVKRHGSILNLSSAVRDSILPHKHVQISIDGNNLIFIPSDDDADYKVSIGQGQRQAKICIFYTSSLVSIPVGVRLYGNRREDDSILIHLTDRE